MWTNIISPRSPGHNKEVVCTITIGLAHGTQQDVERYHTGSPQTNGEVGYSTELRGSRWCENPVENLLRGGVAGDRSEIYFKGGGKLKIDTIASQTRPQCHKVAFPVDQK